MGMAMTRPHPLTHRHVINNAHPVAVLGGGGGGNVHAAGEPPVIAAL